MEYAIGLIYPIAIKDWKDRPMELGHSLSSCKIRLQIPRDVISGMKCFLPEEFSLFL